MAGRTARRATRKRLHVAARTPATLGGIEDDVRPVREPVGPGVVGETRAFQLNVGPAALAVEVRLLVQPMRWRAAKIRRALLAGHRDVAELDAAKAGDDVEWWARLARLTPGQRVFAVGEAVSNHIKSEELRLG